MVLVKAKTMSCLMSMEILACIAIVHWSLSTACGIIWAPQARGKKMGLMSTSVRVMLRCLADGDGLFG